MGINPPPPLPLLPSSRRPVTEVLSDRKVESVSAARGDEFENRNMHP